MNRYFLRLVVCILIPAIVSSDPAWTATRGSPGQRKANPLSVLPHAVMFTQAFIEPLSAGFTETEDHAAIDIRKGANESLRRNFEWAIPRRKVLLGLLLFPASAFGQNPKKEQKQPVPARQAPMIPEAPLVERQNMNLTDQALHDAWHFDTDLSGANRLEYLLGFVINNNPKVVESFYKHRIAWQELLAMLHYEGITWSLRSDQLHAAGGALIGPYSEIAQTLAYPGVSASQPQHRMETAAPGPIDKTRPGFLHWHYLAQLVMKGVQYATAGVQFYSKNQEEAAFLKEHEQGFNVRIAYAELEKTIQDQHELAYRAWLDHASTAGILEELRDSAWINHRAWQRERDAAALEQGDLLGKAAELQDTSQQSEARYYTEQGKLERQRINLLEIIVHTEAEMAGRQANELRPEGPVWEMDQDLLELSNLVSPLLKQERYSNGIPNTEASPGDSAFKKALGTFHLMAADKTPSDFLAEEIRMPNNQISHQEMLDDLRAVFSVIDAESPLGTSPLQRRLQLQQDLLTTVREEALKIQKEGTWQFGSHLDLGSHPFLAALLNFEIKRPDHRNFESIDELITAIHLQSNLIDEQIQAEHLRLRAVFLQARSRRHEALKELISARNQIAKYSQDWNQAIQIESPRIPVDSVTPYLKMERYKKEYARHLTEAWAAWKLMQLYTVEGQERIVNETKTHYLEVLKKLGPNDEDMRTPLNPTVPTKAASVPAEKKAEKAKKPNRRDILKVLRGAVPGVGVIAAFIGSLAAGHVTPAAAHTFVPHVAGSAAKMALDVTLGQWHGGSEDTLTGIAADILRALPGYTGHLSQGDIWDMVYKIADQNGIAHTHSALSSFHPGDTLRIGSYDPTIAEHLQKHLSHSFTSGHPLATPAIHDTLSAPILAHAPTFLPVSHSAPVPHPVIQNALHTALNSIFSSPEHLLIIGGIVTVTAFLAVVFFRSKNLGTNGQPYRPFSVGGPGPWFEKGRTLATRLWIPVFFAALVVLHLQPLTWLIITAAILLGFLIRQRIVGKKFLGVAGAILLVWLMPISSYKEAVMNRVSNRISTLSNADTLATNYGVSIQPVRLPVTWTAPPGGKSVVTEVNKSKLSMGPRDLVIGVQPLDQDLLERLKKNNAEWQAMYGEHLVPPDRIDMAAAKPKALIHISPHFDTSVDHRISDTLKDMDDLFTEHEIARDTAQANAGITGHYALSFEGEAQKFRLRTLGLRLSSLLLERAQLNIPATRAFQLLPGGMRISEGAEIGDAGSVVLFTQQLADSDLLQLKLAPADAGALWSQWRLNPRKTTIQLRASNGTFVQIPLDRIGELPGENDPTFGALIRDENFFGPQYTNPTIGASPTIPVNLIVRQNGGNPALDTGTKYRFEGIFQNGKRVLDFKPGTAMGTLSVAFESTAQPPHRSLRAPLEEQLRATHQLMSHYETLRAEVVTFQQTYRERSVAPRLLLEYDTELTRLRSAATELRLQMENLDQAGVELAGGNIEPLSPVRYNHYPLERRFPTSVLEEGLVNWGNGDILVQVSFYASSEEMGSGQTVRIRIPSTQQSMEFSIKGSKSLDRTNDLTHYFAERRMPASQARMLFPPGLPLTTNALAEVQLNMTSPFSITDWFRSLWSKARWSDSAPETVKHAWVFGIGWPLFRRRRHLRPVDPLSPPLNGDEEEELDLQRIEEPLQGKPDYLDESGLQHFAESLRKTVLEYERYWYRGDSTTYLTIRQIIWDVYILNKKEIPLQERKVFLRRYKRDNVNDRLASILDQHYQLAKEEVSAGSKTRTFLYVLIFGSIGGLALLLFASPEILSSLLKGIKFNPLLLFMTANPGLSIVGSILILFIAIPFIGNAMEWWGKLFATTPWNLKYLKLKLTGAIYAPEKRFEDYTGKDAMKELEKIYDTRILHPLDDDYAEFRNDLEKFSRQITDRAYDRLRADPFDNPSQAAIAFENAFRIQIRRTQLSHIPIYPGHPLKLADEDDLINILRGHHVPYEGLSEGENYRRLDWARVEDAKRMMRHYPIHTLMALLRSGNTEFIADVQEMDHHGLIQQIINELKERVDTLDEDVFDDLRAQERLKVFFDMLHYVFEGLRGRPASADARDQRRRLMKFLERSVIDTERKTWKDFETNLDRLMSEKNRDPNQIESDQNIVRGIVYVLTERNLKEREQDSMKLLADLRRERPHPPEITLKDSYLRGRDGKATTSVLQLNMAYQKYFDLLREFIARFPTERILGSRDIYITCENTVNFRQTFREINLLLRLTRGRVYLVNVASTHPLFAKLLDNNIRERIHWKDRHRVKVISTPTLNPFQKLIRDRRAIILSSAAPIEWYSVRHNAGIRVHEASPLIKPALLVELINILQEDKLHSDFASTRRRLESRFEDLNDRLQELKEKLNPGWPEHQEAAVALGEASHPRKLWRELVQERWKQFSLYRRGKQLTRLQRHYDDLRISRSKTRKELRELKRLEHDLGDVHYFLEGIGITLGQFTDGDKLPDDPPIVVGSDVLGGRYRLDFPSFHFPANGLHPRRLRGHRLEPAA